MKKLIPILFFIFLITSCEKDYCWKCDSYSSFSGRLIGTYNHCGLTEYDIIAMEEKWQNLGYRYNCVKR